MKNKETIYIPTLIEQEFPEDNSVQFELVGDRNTKAIGWYIDGNREHAGARHWLKPTEAYVFTQEELEKLLQDYTNMIVENTEWKSETVYDGDDKWVECKVFEPESITNQLPKFLKTLNNE